MLPDLADQPDREFVGSSLTYGGVPTDEFGGAGIPRGSIRFGRSTSVPVDTWRVSEVGCLELGDADGLAAGLALSC